MTCDISKNREVIKNVQMLSTTKMRKCIKEIRLYKTCDISITGNYIKKCSTRELFSIKFSIIY